MLDGPRGPTFQTFFGSEVTTLVTMALLMFVSFGMAAMSTEQLTKDLSLRASRDGLTGLLNRSGFLELAGDELRRIERSGRSASLILADLDHFKAVNDEHGHSAGDSALQAFAAACTGCVRSTDIVARYGGEEFVILLPGASPDLAEAIAKEIGLRLKIMDSPDIPRLPTASFGIAVTGTGTADLGKTIAAADAALYQAKAQGRNRVVRAAD
jgi:diguanylate cyclase (GGDEF)-like protein